MNVCALKLKSLSSTGSGGESDTADDEEESGLSVTSSEDEVPIESTARGKGPPMNIQQKYGDINEIIASAIEHYKLDENMYKFLPARIHAS